MKTINWKFRYPGLAAFALTMLASIVALSGSASPAQAQGFSKLYEFNNVQVQGMNQQDALGQPIQARDGMMYGYFGCCSIQAIYRMPVNDKATVLGYLPSSACSGNLSLGNDGLLYGVCGNWTNSSNAVIFQMDPNSPNPVASAIYTFSQRLGLGIPDLTVGPDGNFYGISPNDGAANCGTVYRVSLSGSFKALHTFMGGRNDGCFPTGPLYLGKDGNFYGVAQGGFSTGTTNGAIFKISPTGKFKLTVVGLAPTSSTVFSGGVIQASDGYFYGTSSYGGAFNDGYIWKMSTKGVFTDLHDFSTSAPGGLPAYALIQASDGNIYGTASFCDSTGCNAAGSAIFEINLKKKIYVDVFSGFLCMKYEIPLMLKQGRGAIVNTSSGAGVIGIKNSPAYTAAKHGVIGLTRAAALDYAAESIRINVVCPGYIDTPMMDRYSGTPTGRVKVISEEPIGRMGRPEEIANAVVWLCSDAAGFFVGSTVVIDGGQTIQ